MAGDASSSSSDVVRIRSANESVPRPVWEVQTVRHIVCGTVVPVHRGGGCLREVVVEHLSDPVVVSKTNVNQGLIETGDRSTVHLLMRTTVAAVHP
jgi:uncharacterized protein YwlG (UPF0340 family)